MAPALAVQIVNYRTRAHLERCLASVLADLGGSSIDYEINLLDNASGESLDDLARDHPRVSARTAPRNGGFGAGHNLLAAQTTAEHLWLLNPDTELREPRTAERLLQALASRPEIVAVGPRLLTTDGAPEPYDHGRLSGARAQIALRAGHSYWRASTARREVAWVSGAALLVRRAEFEAVEGFDERFFLYKEEEDLCLRLRGAGGEILYVPDVAVSHIGGVVADTSNHRPQSERLYVAKHLRDSPARRALERLHRALAYVHL